MRRYRPERAEFYIDLALAYSAAGDNGKAVAVLVAAVSDDDVESLVLARSPRLQKLLNKSRASIKAGRGLSSKEFWKTVSKRH